MDRSQYIYAHSEEKLAIYGKYLVGYLSVLTNQPYIKNIYVADIFAGLGISKNNKKGSAVIAADAIKSLLDNKNCVKIHFLLNELDPKNHGELKKNLEKYTFPEISNLPADEFVDGFLGKMVRNSRSLLFIDPHGYTQLPQEKIKTLLQKKNIEILIFIPTNNIYRFINPEDPRETVKPVLKFLRDCNIDIAEMQGQGLSGFHLLLKESFQQRADTKFVYAYPLKNQQATNSEHCFFFISHNDLGAEKFLEAVDDTPGKLKFPLFGTDPINLTVHKNIEPFLTKFRSNIELRIWGLENSYLPPIVSDCLKKMQNEERLEFENNRKPRKNAFYLDKKELKYRVRIKNHEQN